MTRSLRIVVAGAGYAGALAAVRAARRLRDRGEVLLVSPDDFLVERIRLHEHVVRGREVRVPLGRFLRGLPAKHVAGRIEGFDRKRREAIVGGERVAFDRLILAIGSAVERDRVDGVREHAWTLDPGRAPELRRALDALAPGSRVAVVGGGLTGVELASELAEARELRVALLTSGPVAELLSERGRDHVRATMSRLGVDLRERTRAERVGARAVETDRGPVAADLVVWCGGFAAPAWLLEAGLAVNRRGQAIVDPFLRAVGHEAVLVAGDAASPAVDPGHPVSMSCKTGMPMGAHAADVAVDELLGRTPRPFDFGES
ncbi:MAG TPA: FAD-dependent oxidoreductase, partial [Planctomycetota bacterium]|nr:FAD-dependent oxidoreductase [Planctomycetota bacterium]